MCNISSVQVPGKWISRLYRGFNSYLKANIDFPGLGSGQIPILMGLSQSERISQDELARQINIDRTTLNRTIRPLIQHGYIHCQPNLQDRRANSVTLTVKGRSILSEIRTILNRWNSVMLEGFNEEEKKIFTEMLYRATQNVTAINKG